MRDVIASLVARLAGRGDCQSVPATPLDGCDQSPTRIELVHVFVRLFAVTGLILFKFGISCFCKHLWTQPNFGQNIVDF